uniref:very short patch repair endonuclease n=1 Tax=Streptomyces sp. NRRL S-325 TaxID=1463899 RepID=UPI00099BA7D7|nr:very short patch repair endonuclease [Streptomyces sp. NRRL S-325]
MRQQHHRGTSQELAVRRILHRAGLRYRVHVPVPGLPRRRIDIAFTKLRVAVFLNGCFWHSCPDHATRPKENADWWQAKLERNVKRDRETADHLSALGWMVLHFWEHDVPDVIAARVRNVVVARRPTLSGDPSGN